MSYEALSEISPIIVCDVSLGKILTNLEVDSGYFTDMMRHEGVSDEEITKTTLFLSADSMIRDYEDGYSKVRVGEYITDTKTVKINIGSYVDVIKYEISNLYTGEIPNDDSIDQRISSKISETAKHEVSHRIDDVILGLEGIINEDLDHYKHVLPGNYVRRLIRRAMILTRIPELVLKARKQQFDDLQEAKEKADHDTYENSPVEARARNRSGDTDSSGYQPVRISLGN